MSVEFYFKVYFILYFMWSFFFMLYEKKKKILHISCSCLHFIVLYLFTATFHEIFKNFNLLNHV